MLDLKESIKEFDRARERKRRGVAARANVSEVNAFLKARQDADRKELIELCKDGWLK